MRVYELSETFYNSNKYQTIYVDSTIFFKIYMDDFIETHKNSVPYFNTLHELEPVYEELRKKAYKIITRKTKIKNYLHNTI